MNQNPENRWSLELSAARDALVISIGDTALLPVTTPSPESLNQTLNEQVGAKPDSPRRSDLFPAIAALGGQTLSAVDVVLAIQGMVDKYKADRDLVVEVIEDELVPQYLSVIAQEADKPTRNALRVIWRSIRDERYPEPENRYQKRMANKTKRKPTKFDPTRSASFRQSAQAARVKSDTDN